MNLVLLLSYFTCSLAASSRCTPNIETISPYNNITGNTINRDGAGQLCSACYSTYGDWYYFESTEAGTWFASLHANYPAAFAVFSGCEDTFCTGANLLMCDDGSTSMTGNDRTVQWTNDERVHIWIGGANLSDAGEYSLELCRTVDSGICVWTNQEGRIRNGIAMLLFMYL